MFAPESKDIIEKRVRELGFRMTAQRQLILEAIERAGEHATFGEISDEVKSVAPSISKATIYRTLETFSRYRLIHGNEIAGGKIYEVVTGDPHHHLICHNCWSDEKIEEEAFKEFQEKIVQENGFLVLSEHNIFMGLCPECRQKHGDTLGRFSIYPKFMTDAQQEEQRV
jgi:Fur family ferric uptake transcriptional regulator